MISSVDIQNKMFSRSVRGYKEDEVDDFLTLLAEDVENMRNENYQLKETVKKLSSELEKHKSSESAVLNTLEAAKALMGDISISAEKRADILLKNAELDAELIQREAKENAERLNEECMTLKNRVNIFAERYRNMLLAELDKFENLKTEMFEDRIFSEIDVEKQDRSATVYKPGRSSNDNKQSSDMTITNFRPEDYK